MSRRGKIFEDLNPEQEAAVRAIDGPVLVFAGAGTGKTRVITHRIAHMIDSGISPGNIAGMTFTNKAAQEMMERLNNLIGRESAKEVFLGTFHSFCARVLRREIHILGWTSNYSIADETDQISIVKKAIAAEGYDKEELSAPNCMSVISRAKSSFMTPMELGDSTSIGRIKDISHVFKRYNAMLFSQNMVDFDDLLVLTVKIFEENPDVLKKYTSKYRYLLVDEYQDTNLLQFRLIKLLAANNRNLCVVGDDDQSIYGWRGAEIRNILDFPKNFKGTKEFKLEHNYRSTNSILKAANSIISSNKNRCAKELWSDCGKGEPILFANSPNDIAETNFVAVMIEELMMTHRDLNYNDIAVLYRSNYQSRGFETSLRDYGIPYRIVGARSFYERAEIRDAIAYLKLLVNPKDEQSFMRIIGSPPRGIGDKALADFRDAKTRTGDPFPQIIGDEKILSSMSSKAAAGARKLADTMQKWKKEFSRHGKLADKAEKYLKEVGFIDGLLTMYKDREEAMKRQENVFELINAIAVFEMNSEDKSNYTLRDYLENYSLYDDSDKVEDNSENKNTVTLMTVHAAKGLEFPFVFIVGMEDGIFPHERAIEERGEEEERRLFYVALTRAKRRLFISAAMQRMKHGQLLAQRPSSFLFGIPDDLIEESHFRGAQSKTMGYSSSRKPKKKWGEAFYNFDD